MAGILVGSAIATVTSTDFKVNTTMNVQNPVYVIVTLGGQRLTVGANSATWNSLVAGQTYTQSLVITNNGVDPLQISLTLTAPSGWSYVDTTTTPINGETIASGATITGTLSLIVPSTTITGSYSSTVDIQFTPT